jgi:hypothetical protein
MVTVLAPLQDVSYPPQLPVPIPGRKVIDLLPLCEHTQVAALLSAAAVYTVISVPPPHVPTFHVFVAAETLPSAAVRVPAQSVPGRLPLAQPSVTV